MTVLKKICLAGMVFLAVLHQVSAQTYAPAVNYTVGNNPVSPLVVDVNGDGKPDIICANFGSGSIYSGDGNTLSILTNTGNGTFTLASSPLVGNGPRSIAAGDIYGDGRVDLVCANSDDNTISILTNTGGGTFVLSTNLDMRNYALNNYPMYVRLADYNGDGKLGLFVIMNHGAELVTLTNNGNGGFGLAIDEFFGNLQAGWIPPDLTTTADVNGDGQPDLISGSSLGFFYGTLSGNTISVSLSVPTLTINNTNSNATVFWPSGWINWKLLQSSNLITWTTNNNVFDDGTNVSCTVTAAAAPNHLYFRLAH